MRRGHIANHSGQYLQCYNFLYTKLQWRFGRKGIVSRDFLPLTFIIKKIPHTDPRQYHKSFSLTAANSPNFFFTGIMVSLTCPSKLSVVTDASESRRRKRNSAGSFIDTAGLH